MFCLRLIGNQTPQSVSETGRVRLKQMLEGAARSAAVKGKHQREVRLGRRSLWLEEQVTHGLFAARCGYESAQFPLHFLRLMTKAFEELLLIRGRLSTERRNNKRAGLNVRQRSADGRIERADMSSNEKQTS